MNEHDRAAEILATVRDRFGIAFNETMTGGGCMALEARLESGHWIVATDEGLMGFTRRIAYENQTDFDDFDDGGPCAGWSIGIYPNSNEYGADWWGGTDSIVDIVDYGAYAADLPDMVQRALDALVASHGAR